MNVPSRGSPTFWKYYRALPAEVKAVARKNYQLWRADALHPSLHFKRIRRPWWSVRVGDNYRAVGGFEGNVFVWEWIGAHAEYDRRY
ncbi:MAG: hypothetical protein ABMA13_19950 [Chthoniobacteraceae bacterium]